MSATSFREMDLNILSVGCCILQAGKIMTATAKFYIRIWSIIQIPLPFIRTLQSEQRAGSESYGSLIHVRIKTI